MIPQGTYRIVRSRCLQQRYLVIVETEFLGFGLCLIRQSGNPFGTACIGFTDTDFARCSAPTTLRATGAPPVELAENLLSFTGPLLVLLYQVNPGGNVLGSLQCGQLGTMKVFRDFGHQRLSVIALHLWGG